MKKLLMLFLFFGLLGCNFQKETQESKAYSFAKDYIYQRLKVPSTAVFLPFDEKRITITEDLACVEIVVDAENSFGAKLRSTYTVLLNKSGNSYSVMYADEGDFNTVLERVRRK